MDYAKEEYFVKNFIVKDRRERLLYELTTPKKRYDGLDRFCHQAKGLLDPSKIFMEGVYLEYDRDFERFVKQHPEDCLVLSPAFYDDGQMSPLKEAVSFAREFPDAVILIGDGFSIVFTEPMKGGREKYLLTENGK